MIYVQIHYRTIHENFPYNKTSNNLFSVFAEYKRQFLVTGKTSIPCVWKQEKH